MDRDTILDLNAMAGGELAIDNQRGRVFNGPVVAAVSDEELEAAGLQSDDVPHLIVRSQDGERVSRWQDLRDQLHDDLDEYGQTQESVNDSTDLDEQMRKRVAMRRAWLNLKKGTNR